MVFYHATNKDKATVILKEGLKPMIGDNSFLVGEKTPAIYLSKRKSIEFWKEILQKDIVLKIDLPDDIAITSWSYGKYEECICYTEIPPQYIKRICIKTTEKIKEQVLLSYIDTINYLILSIIRYYNKQHDLTLSSISANINNTLKVLKRFDYSKLDKKAAKKWLENNGDNGNYTLCDTYLNTKTKLWEKIVEFDDDELKPYCTELYKWIKENLKGFLDANTGGWTG